MIPLHITSTELAGLVVLIITMFALIAYFAYRAGALSNESSYEEVKTDG
jgi:hypothetical protein